METTLATANDSKVSSLVGPKFYEKKYELFSILSRTFKQQKSWNIFHRLQENFDALCSQTSRKPIQAWTDDQDYRCRYKNHKFHVRYGVKITKVKRAKRLKQEPRTEKCEDNKTKMQVKTGTDSRNFLPENKNNSVVGK